MLSQQQHADWENSSIIRVKISKLCISHNMHFTGGWLGFNGTFSTNSAIKKDKSVLKIFISDR